jgi:quinol monooxygenase YgiN
MIIRIVKMTFKPDLAKDFLNLFNENKNHIAGFEGCTHLELLNDRDNPATFFTYSKWENEHFLEKYRNSELFNTVWDQTKKLFDAKPEAWTVTKM